MKTIKQYEVAQKYNKIIYYLTHDYPKITNYAGPSTEPSENQNIKQNINILMNYIRKILYQLTIIKSCFDYELDQYQKQTQLSSQDNIDIKYCKHIISMLIAIMKSEIKTKIYFDILTKKINNIHIAKNSILHKALCFELKKQLQRCKYLEQQILTNYISISIIRPYCKYLQQQQLSFNDDIQTHLDISVWKSYKIIKPDIDRYIKHIAAYINTTTYKTERLKEANKYYEKKLKQNQEKEFEKNIKQAQYYKNMLQKFCTEKEYSFSNCVNRTHPTIEHLMKKAVHEPNFNGNQCFIIVILFKPEKGPRYFRYLTKSDIVTRINSIDLFLFQQTIPDEIKQRIQSYPDVKAFGTIHLIS